MKIGLVQFDIAWEDKAENQRRITALIERCDSLEGVDWLVFPEMTLTGFSMNPEKSVVDENDRAFFEKLARQYGLFLTFGGVSDLQNRQFTIDRAGRQVGDYAKIHLFSFAGESSHYRPGEKANRFVLDETAVSPFICYDLRFPYFFWGASEKTDLFCGIASWPARRVNHWKSLLQARAIENQCFVIGVNRVGSDPNAEYCGASSIFDPLGNQVLDCSSAVGIFCADVDIGMVCSVRERFPFMKDRREGFQKC